MSILQEILVWTRGLPAWQSDAIARLFVKQNLDAEDIDDLFVLLKAEHGIPDTKGSKANRLSADQIPVPAQSDIHVELIGIKNLQHVNAIANNQKLAFKPQGLTIIYGDNATGKSGYSRVMKRACRARDQSEPIHPTQICQLQKQGRQKRYLRFLLMGKPGKSGGLVVRRLPEYYQLLLFSTIDVLGRISIPRMTWPTCPMVSISLRE